jgi:hypothetical protein
MRVNRVAPEPSWSQVQMSQFPERPEVKAILRPSAEKAGCTEWNGDEMNGAPAAGAWTPAPGRATRQMLMAIVDLVYASRFPLRAIDGQ